MKGRQSLAIAAGLILSCGFLLCAALAVAGFLRLGGLRASATPDLAGTIQALIGTQAAATLTPTVGAAPGEPTGHIVFTCQLYKYQSSEQICIMAADGSGYRRLTMDDGVRHYYPSLSPDGRSVVYSQYTQDNVYDLYEMSLATGQATQLTKDFGVLTGPEISPDGAAITFMRWTVASNQDQLWVMDRAGGQARRVVDGSGWDPTWSPDGGQILFASDRAGAPQLYAVRLDGSALRKVTNLPALRGRSDWSAAGQIVTYSGAEWAREVYILNADGSQVRQLTPAGGDSQGPSFSPDGKWVAFTAYYGDIGDINGCEIYIIRTDGTDLRRLTKNQYCDYQPRWGP